MRQWLGVVLAIAWLIGNSRSYSIISTYMPHLFSRANKAVNSKLRSITYSFTTSVLLFVWTHEISDEGVEEITPSSTFIWHQSVVMFYETLGSYWPPFAVGNATDGYASTLIWITTALTVTYASWHIWTFKLAPLWRPSEPKLLPYIVPCK